MRYGILGPLELTRDGRAIEVPGAKQRALLAILLLNANRVVSSDALIEALWEDQPPDGALKALQVRVSQLRKLVGKASVETRPPGYLLRVAPDALDLERFGRLAAEGELDAAFALWRGPPLAEFAYRHFARVRSPVCRSFISAVWRSGSTATWPAAGMPSSSVSWRAW